MSYLQHNVLLQSWIEQIKPLHRSSMNAAEERQGRLTKPAGALGRLEALSIQLAGSWGNLVLILPTRWLSSWLAITVSPPKESAPIHRV